MGLDFDRSDASWSYGGFHRFRERLAEEIDIELDNMVGFGGDISWNTIKDDIKHLLNHSDCQGYIGSNRCGLIAVRLKELVKNWDDDDYDKRMALKLAMDMKGCKNANKRLNFC